MSKDAGGLHVLFLDMDGVLLPFGSDVHEKTHSPLSNTNRLFPDEPLAALSHILSEVPSLVLVLSSTWRVRQEFCNEIIKSFQSYGKQHGGPLATIEDFYDVTDIHNHSERQWEIHAWLSAQPNIRAWVALDDEELIEGDCNRQYRDRFLRHVIKTSSAVGLTDQDAQHAILLIMEQIQGKHR
jgi:hypothetical protein